MTDWYLLRKFRDDRSEAAFAQLVSRYIKLVYSVCYAELHNAQAAEDATQAVFLVLARKPEFQRGSTLAGWLFRTARYVAQHARRAELRRGRLQDELTVLHSESISNPQMDVDTQAALNEAVNALRESDREVLLLRYYQDLTLVEVGEALGVSEEAARKRVSRGLDRLRASLQRHGAGTAIGTLTVVAAAVPSEARRAVLLHCISQSIVFGAAKPVAVTAAHQITLEVIRKMSITKIQWTLACALALASVGSGTAYVMGQGAGGALTGAEQSMAPSPAPRAPSHEEMVEKESLARMQQLEAAFALYIHDTKYRTLPPMDSDAQIHKTLDLYVDDPRIYIQPGVNKPYQFNRTLSRTRYESYVHPESMILFTESKPRQNRWRYIAYVDGHVKLQSRRTYVMQLYASTPMNDRAVYYRGHF